MGKEECELPPPCAKKKKKSKTAVRGRGCTVGAEDETAGEEGASVGFARVIANPVLRRFCGGSLLGSVGAVAVAGSGVCGALGNDDLRRSSPS